MVLRILLCLCLPAIALGATPSISSTSGTFSGGNTITISGSNFGAKSPAAPAIWDDFEWGSDGDFLSDNGWTAYYGHLPMPALDDSRSYAGSLSAYQRKTSANEFSDGYKTITSTDTMFVSFYVYWHHEGSWPEPNSQWKPSRINSVTVYSGEPAIKIAAQPEISYYYSGIYNGTDTYTKGTYSYGEDGWHKIEYFMLLSDPPGTSNGYADIWIDLRSLASAGWPFEGVTRATGETDELNILMLPFMWARPATTYSDVWCDDVYVDNTRARVEIGDASAWGACTHREIQIPSAWAAGEITITCNQGSFGGTANAYLYVVDSDGAVSAGYAMQFGGGGGGQPGSGRPCIIQ